MTPPDLHPWFVAGWLLWAAWFAVLEWRGLVLEGERRGTLTAMVEWLIAQHPGAMVVAIFLLLAWLALHFLVEPFQR